MEVVWGRGAWSDFRVLSGLLRIEIRKIVLGEIRQQIGKPDSSPTDFRTQCPGLIVLFVCLVCEKGPKSNIKDVIATFHGGSDENSPDFTYSHQRTIP